MKILLLGAGSMGAKAAQTLASFDEITRVTVADLKLEAAERVASACGDKAFALQLDVTDRTSLMSAMAEADCVANLTGPFFRFGELVLGASIDAGKHYVDICDDPEPTLAMLAYDKAAQEKGVTAIVGLGASPGLTNLLAVQAHGALDEVEALHTGWSLDNTGDKEDPLDNIQQDGSISAALVHWMEQCSGQVNVWQDGTLTSGKPVQPFEIAYPDIGRRVLYTVGHPEAVTLARTFPELTTSLNFMVLSELDAMAVTEMGKLIDAGTLTVEEAAAIITDSIAASRAPGATDSPPQERKLPSFPPLFALAQGCKDGKALQSFAHLTALPPGGMAGATGVPLAVGLKMLAQGLISRRGVFAPEAGINLTKFFDMLHPHATYPHPVQPEKFVKTNIAPVTC